MISNPRTSIFVHLRSIEEHIKSKTSKTLGYGSTCYAMDPGPVSKNKSIKKATPIVDSDDTLKLRCDDMTKDGMQFLATISCRGEYNTREF